MLKKPSRFDKSGAYDALKKRVVDRLKAFYERFTGLGA